MIIPLYIDVVNKVAVTSVTNGKPFKLPPMNLSDEPQFVATFLEPNPTGGSAEPFTVVDVTPLSLQIAVGELHGTEAGSPIVYQDTWAKDEDYNTFTGTLDFDTTAVLKRINDSPAGSIKTVFEVLLIEDGRKSRVWQSDVKIIGSVIRPSGETPDPVVDFAQFASDVGAVLQNTTTITLTQSGGKNLAAAKLKTNGGLTADADGLFISYGTGAGQAASGASPFAVTTTNTISGSVATGAASLNVKLKTDGGLAADSNGIYIDVGGGAGTQFGTSTANKLGFWGATPVIQQAGGSQAAVTLGNADNEIGGLAIGGSYSQSEVQALRDKTEELADDMRGLSTLLHAIRSALVTLGIIKGSA